MFDNGDKPDRNEYNMVCWRLLRSEAMLNKNLHKERLQYQERLRWTMRAASKLSGNNGPSARAGAQDRGQDISSAVGSMFCLENLQHQSFHWRGDSC